MEREPSSVGPGPSKEAIDTYWAPRCVFRFGPHRVVVDGFVNGMEPAFHRDLSVASLTRGGSTLSAASSSSSIGTQLPMPTPLPESPPKTAYILSHFHSDHYMGIRSTFHRGNIFCTRITARLLETVLGVNPMLLRPLDMGVVYRIDTTTGDLVDERRGNREPWSVDVMLVDANHCPGAAIIVFWTHEGLIVHTGDFRFSPPPRALMDDAAALSGAEAQRSQRATPSSSQAPKISSYLGRRNPPRRGGGPAAAAAARAKGAAATPSNAITGPAPAFDHPLAPFRGKVDTLFLDNTFCDPKYVFPSQSDSVELGCARAAPLLRGSGRKLVAFGTYTIGKERFAFGCRDKLLAGAPIFAAPSKFALLKHCELVEAGRVLPLPISDDASYATGGLISAADLCAAAQSDLVFVFVPLDAFGYKRMSADPGTLTVATKSAGAEFKIDLKGFSAVVGFEPTGWAASASPSEREKRMGQLTRISIPYSEHCSWTELVDFVAYLDPKRVVPTVSVEQYTKHETHFVERARQLKPKHGGTRPITSFFKKHRAESVQPSAAASDTAVEVVSVDDDDEVAVNKRPSGGAAVLLLDDEDDDDDERFEVMSDDGVKIDSRNGCAIEID